MLGVRQFDPEAGCAILVVRLSYATPLARARLSLSAYGRGRCAISYQLAGTLTNDKLFFFFVCVGFGASIHEFSSLL